MITETTLINDRYQLERKLGQGGFARVYLATDRLLKRQVAVKVLHSELTDQENFKTRFEQEAQSIAGLNHPNILGVYDYGFAEETSYLVMPYIEGGTLFDKIKRDQGLPLPLISRYLQQAAAGLDYAHQRKIVHRDIKPQNMLLQTESDTLMLSDFGISKVLTGANAQSSTGAIGTPAYMSPEQLRGTVTTATDIYALGCVLFQMISGKVPFSGTTEQIITSHLLDPVPSVAMSSPRSVPESVQPVIEKALAKDPGERFATAGEMALAFDNVINGRPMRVGATRTQAGWSPLTNNQPSGFTPLGDPLAPTETWPQPNVSQPGASQPQPSHPTFLATPLDKTYAQPRPSQPQPVNYTSPPAQSYPPPAQSQGYTPSQPPTLPQPYSQPYGVRPDARPTRKSNGNLIAVLVGGIVFVCLMAVLAFTLLVLPKPDSNNSSAVSPASTTRPATTSANTVAPTAGVTTAPSSNDPNATVAVNNPPNQTTIPEQTNVAPLPTTPATPSPTPAPAFASGKVGERVSQNDYALTINSVERTNKPNASTPAVPGIEYLLLDITFESGGDINLDSALFFFGPLIYDNEGYLYSYDSGLNRLREPALGAGAGSLSKSQKTKGWLAYRLPEGKKGLVLDYPVLPPARTAPVARFRVALDDEPAVQLPPAPQPVGTEGKVGQTVGQGAYVLTVSNVEIADSFTDAEGRTRKAKVGYQYVAVEMTFQNVGAAQSGPNHNDVKLVDSENQPYTRNFIKFPAIDEVLSVWPEGSKIRGWLTYEVPKTAKGFVLEFRPTVSKSPVLLRVSLDK